MRQYFTRLILSLSFLFFHAGQQYLIAQHNGGMESWSPSGSPPPFDWTYPTGWTTNNATTEFIAAGVTRSPDEHDGSYAAQIKTLNIFGTNTRSQLVLGKCKLDYPNYQALAYTGGEELFMIPGSVSFFYKLTVGDPAEYAVADILIKRPTGTTEPDTLYYRSVSLQAASAYTEMHISIPEVGVDIETDSIVIAFSSNDTDEVAVNVLLIDDVNIDFVSATKPGPSVVGQISVFPNPVRQGEILAVQHPGEKWQSIKILDASGHVVNSSGEWSGDDTFSKLESDSMPPGMYSLIVDGRNRGRFVVVE